MEVSIPSNTEQELLAEIQLYRDKQKRWEESKLARMIREGALHSIFWLSNAWCMVLAVAGFVPSILPSNHAELSAINAGFHSAGVLLGLYGIVTMWYEKKSITQFDHFESRAAVNKKAHGLLNQLKQNQETYQQKVEEELRKSFYSLSLLLIGVYGYMLYAMLKNRRDDNFVAVLLFFVFFLSTYAARFYCAEMAQSDQETEEKQLAVQK